MNKTGWLRGRNLLATACMFGALSASPAWADEAQPKPSPRTAVEIGGASVVLVTANDRLYAFVDRLDDNAPVADGKLGVALPDGSNLLLTQVSDGYYVAPYDRTGHMRDAFLVSLASADGWPSPGAGGGLPCQALKGQTRISSAKWSSPVAGSLPARAAPPWAWRHAFIIK